MIIRIVTPRANVVHCWMCLSMGLTSRSRTWWTIIWWELSLLPLSPMNRLLAVGRVGLLSCVRTDNEDRIFGRYKNTQLRKLMLDILHTSFHRQPCSFSFASFDIGTLLCSTFHDQTGILLLCLASGYEFGNFRPCDLTDFSSLARSLFVRFLPRLFFRGFCFVLFDLSPELLKMIRTCVSTRSYAGLVILSR
jgi:hypothetical protein